MRFNSSKNIYMVSLLWLTIIFLSLVPFIPETEDELELEPASIIGLAILYLIIGLLAWMLLDTNYILKQNKLHYHCGPIRGKIDVMQIHQVEHVTSLFVYSFLKPALGSYGLTIRYNKFDDIYISPKEKEKFIAELLKINPAIKVV
jgi:hypothetical protein